jgi:hypothetical protein
VLMQSLMRDGGRSFPRRSLSPPGYLEQGSPLNLSEHGLPDLESAGS